MQQSLSGLGKNTCWLLVRVFTSVSFMLHVSPRCVALAWVTLRSVGYSRLIWSSVTVPVRVCSGSVSRCDACDWCVCWRQLFMSFKQQFYLPVSEEIVLYFCWNYLPAGVLAWYFKEGQHTELGSAALFPSIFLNQLSARSDSSQDAGIFHWVLGARKWDPTS